MRLARSLTIAAWIALLTGAVDAQVCLSTSLAITQPEGPGSILLQVVVDLNDPTCVAGETCFCAFTLDSANASMVGDGWWGGLHISVYDVIAQWSSGVDPFKSTISPAGTYTFQLGVGMIPPSLSGFTFYAIARTFSVGTIYLTGSSEVVAITLI